MSIRTHRKTRKQKEVEDRMYSAGTYNTSYEIEHIVLAEVRNYGLSLASQRMGVTKSTLGYWMLKLGLRMERVVLRDDEEVKVVKAA